MYTKLIEWDHLEDLGIDGMFFIIKMELKEIGVIHLVHDSNNWQALTALDICVP